MLFFITVKLINYMNLAILLSINFVCNVYCEVSLLLVRFIILVKVFIRFFRRIVPGHCAHIIVFFYTFFTERLHVTQVELVGIKLILNLGDEWGLVDFIVDFVEVDLLEPRVGLDLLYPFGPEPVADVDGQQRLDEVLQVG